MSVRYLIPSSVIDYIDRNGLYLDESDKAASSWLFQQRAPGVPSIEA